MPSGANARGLMHDWQFYRPKGQSRMHFLCENVVPFHKPRADVDIVVYCGL